MDFNIKVPQVVFMGDGTDPRNAARVCPGRKCASVARPKHVRHCRVLGGGGGHIRFCHQTFSLLNDPFRKCHAESQHGDLDYFSVKRCAVKNLLNFGYLPA